VNLGIQMIIFEGDFFRDEVVIQTGLASLITAPVISDILRGRMALEGVIWVVSTVHFNGLFTFLHYIMTRHAWSRRKRAQGRSDRHMTLMRKPECDEDLCLALNLPMLESLEQCLHLPHCVLWSCDAVSTDSRIDHYLVVVFSLLVHSPAWFYLHRNE
jgi:hypothetical protein